MSLKSLHAPGALWHDIKALSLLFTPPLCFFSPPLVSLELIFC